MKSNYDKWIKDNVKKTYGKCVEVTERMQKEFPELIRVRGHYHCAFDGARSHWWLKTEDGQIVDPTGSQFKGYPMGEYDEWEEGRKEPMGKCMECGNYAFNSSNFCSQKCLDIYSKDMGWEAATL